MKEILSEIVPLSQSDCFYIVERRKSSFNYPIHRHKEMELNLVQGAPGAQRVVGDSVETIGDIDMVLTGPDLEHAWSQGNCKSNNIHEITVQFDSSLFPESLLARNQFASIRDMLKKAENGLCFPVETIMKTYSLMDSLNGTGTTFNQFQNMLSILYILSLSEYKVLASSAFTKTEKSVESKRIHKVKEFINENHSRDLTLDEIASEIGMSPSALSRFFKEKTGKTMTDYILSIRLGDAARSLIDTSMNISEICYASGFNNLSNFNRLFRRSKGMSPKEFRQMYKKHKIIV